MHYARNIQHNHRAARHDPAATMLGAAQEQWLYRHLARENLRLALLAQGVLLRAWRWMTSGRLYLGDQWDGTTANRAIILSGDVHSFWINELWAK